MKYEEAKRKLDESGITETSGNVFLLSVYNEHSGRALSLFKINFTLISTKDKIDELSHLIIYEKYSKEDALKKEGILDSEDLDIYLCAIDGQERTCITLKYYLDQRPNRQP